MGSVTGGIDYNQNSTGQDNLGQIVNNVSQFVIGVDASDEGQTPSKTLLKKLANDAHRKICNKHNDWQFMNVTGTVLGYDLDTTTTTYNETSNPSGYAITIDSAVNTSYYWGNKVIIPNDKVYSVTDMSTAILRTGAGFGNLNGTLQAVIVSDLNGSPNVADVIAQSTDYTVLDNVITEIDETIETSTPYLLSFDDVTGEILKHGETYWFLFKWVTNSSNGDSFLIQTNSVTPSSYASWTTLTGNVVLNYNYLAGNFITTLTVDSDVQKILKLYYGDTILEEQKQYDRGNDLNSNTLEGNKFRIVRVNPNGTISIEINTALTVEEWNIEYKTKVTQLTNDADEPLIPAEYRYLMEKDMTLTCLAAGWGIFEPEYRVVILEEFKSGLEDLEFSYREHQGNIKIDVLRGNNPGYNSRFGGVNRLFSNSSRNFK